MSDIKIFAEDIEQEALDQIKLISSLDAFKDAKIRIMPDVHAGKGCVCGFTANLGDKVVPNLIGVDEGCGMLTVELGNIGIDFEKLDGVIHEDIPSGMNVHSRLSNFTVEGYKKYDCDPENCYAKFQKKDYQYFKLSAGTLGSGNHFQEIDWNPDTGNKYLVIHTGSRNLGKKVCEYWQNKAIESATAPLDMPLREMIKETKIRCYEAGIGGEKLKDEIEKTKEKFKKMVEESLPKNPDLAYLTGEDREHYIHDMKLAQRWAMLNRYLIAFLICRKMGWLEDGDIPKSFSTVHNYLGDDNIIRKSAISAKKGEKVLIPLNMRDGSIIGIGKGNEDWNNSAPHGAGRKMSRRKAKETLNMEDFRNTMSGIYTTSVSEDTIDEAPFAYKDSESIIRQIKDTVDVVEVIKPLYNFKAAEKLKFVK